VLKIAPVPSVPVNTRSVMSRNTSTPSFAAKPDPPTVTVCVGLTIPGVTVTAGAASADPVHTKNVTATTPMELKRSLISGPLSDPGSEYDSRRTVRAQVRANHGASTPIHWKLARV
jgi:hypothetical protein